MQWWHATNHNQGLSCSTWLEHVCTCIWSMSTKHGTNLGANIKTHFLNCGGKHLVRGKNTLCGDWSVKSDDLVPQCGVQGFVGRCGALRRRMNVHPDSRLKVWQILHLSKFWPWWLLVNSSSWLSLTELVWRDEEKPLNNIEGRDSLGVGEPVLSLLRCWKRRAGRILPSGTDSSSCCISAHFGGFRSPSHQIYSCRAGELVPGEKPDERIKTQNITKDDSIPLCSHVCQSTGSRWTERGSRQMMVKPMWLWSGVIDSFS